MRRAQIDIVASSGSRGRGVDDLLTAAGPGVEPIDSGWSVAVGSR